MDIGEIKLVNKYGRKVFRIVECVKAALFALFDVESRHDVTMGYGGWLRWQRDIVPNAKVEYE